jgi:2-polyprenyl-3-methyl-5-hydroxy-6-metoxy-1,4-benzoquinol methylase
MAIGPRIRRLLGAAERPIANLYRAAFIDLGALARAIGGWAPASKILEVGCGEGAMTTKLSKIYPGSVLVGIDVIPTVGRLFDGDRDRVTFRQQAVEDCVAADGAAFDLVVICDVMHHVPWEMHAEILANVMKTLRPGGRLVLKDWERRATLIHLLCYISDRYITGDRIRYGKSDYFRRLIHSVFGPESIERELCIPPWRNNIAFLIRASA